MPLVQAHPGVSTMAGTPQEVRSRLGQSRAERVLAVAFEHANPGHFDTLVQAVASMVSLADVLIQRREREALERLVEVLVPKAPLPPHLLQEAGMIARARKAVLESTEWLTAAQVAQLAGLSTRNPSAQPNKWKKQRQIFAIHHGGVDYFPSYGLDRDAGFRPLKAMGQVLKVFGDRKDGWGLAYWFLSANSFLGGKRPQDLLATEAQRVIAAAEDEIQDVAHG